MWGNPFKHVVEYWMATEQARSWNDGNEPTDIPLFHYSIIPLFHYSIIPFQHRPVRYFLASLKFLTILCALSVRTS